MNTAQQGLYLREWGKVRRILRQTMSPKDADAQRHALHVKALGKDKSSASFTNSDLDAVLKELRAISQPGNLKTQVELDDMAAERKRFSIRQLLDALELGEPDVELMIWRRQQAGVLVTCSPTAAVTFETLGAADLSPIFIDLKKKCRARWKGKGDLLTEIRVLRMTADLDEETTAAAITAAFKTSRPPRLETLSYDELLPVLAILRRMANGQPTTPTPAAASEDPCWDV